MSDFCPKAPGSFVDALLSLALHCRQRFGLETLCIFPEDARDRNWLAQLADQGVRLGFVPRGPASVPAMNRLLGAHKPIIVHSHFTSYDLPAAFLKLFYRRDSSVVWHQHNVAPLTPRQRAKDLLKVRGLSQLVDRFIAVGESALENSRARGFSDHKLALIENGIDLTRFQMDEGTRTRIRESLGVAEEQFVYLLLGWEPDRKGVDRFVQAAVKTTRAAEAPALFLIVGERATRDFVARLPESLSLGDRLRVIDPVEDFPALLSAIDVMVSSSRREAFGYAVVESMAAGKMVLSSDIPGARKTYGESQGVWLFPVEDASAQAAAMARVRALPAVERDALGSANARYVADRYSVTAWAQRVGDVYQDLLTPRSRWR